MLKVSVSNLELFRVWQEEEDLDTGWLLERLLNRVPQTPQQRAGEALHKALEELRGPGEFPWLAAMGYRFLFGVECVVPLFPLREVPMQKTYCDVLVSGRMDATTGIRVMDYKSGDRFDGDRLMSSYQWRYYLDMSDASRFEWRWFRLSGTDDPYVFEVTEFQSMTQTWYPDLHADCQHLVREYADFAKRIPALREKVNGQPQS